MNHLLFERSIGPLRASAFARTQSSHLIHSIQPCPKIQFDGGEKEITPEDSDGEPAVVSSEESRLWAHQSGANALAIDVESRILLSGGADSSLRIWDLGNHSSSSGSIVLKPSASISRTASAHKFGITHLSFYPFDSAAFLSSSYDHRLKLYATETQQVSADFDLSSIVYTHALSPIASHLLVACATQHPAVRLVDLRSGSNTHSLAGHHGALLSLAWSPRIEHILASGGTDSTVRLWDIRKSSAALGVLDMEDSEGITEDPEIERKARSRFTGKSHSRAVNGLTWTGDGCHIVSAAHDDRVRVWSASTGANTLVNFGPTLRNGHLSTLPLVVSPSASVATGQDLLFYPNERELLVFELHQGRLLKRLRVPGPNIAAVRSKTGERNVKSRITSLVWKGQADGIYSSHTDGQIRAWLPRAAEDDLLDMELESAKREADGEGDDKRERKRQVLNTVFRDLTKQKITFG
ncbi:WD40-repeat-containing domain protein [Amylocarpus encephaloides]|uniref:WD40-repeat-containing domain protein n=1 Tax=Amylocarpus encephaloides TaxID=45428 RepID=A0A9P7YDX4_9HELO|nr:WD40-repeat-containing domain protein [Amylocarpus encephaloides]